MPEAHRGDRLEVVGLAPEGQEDRDGWESAHQLIGTAQLQGSPATHGASDWPRQVRPLQQAWVVEQV